jgi:hypothetical protein
MRPTIVIAVLAAWFLLMPALVLGADAAGPREGWQVFSRDHARAVRRCMRVKGLPTRWGGRGGQLARAAHVSACERELASR